MIPAQIGDRVALGNHLGMIEQINGENALIRFDSGDTTWSATGQLRLIAPATPAGMGWTVRKTHKTRNVVIAIVALAAFFLLAALVIGDKDTRSSAPVATTTQPTAAPAPEPVPTTEELKSHLADAGVTCDTDWVPSNGGAAEVEACGNYDGSAVGVIDFSAVGMSGTTYVDTLKQQGTMSGMFVLYGNTWAVFTPTRSEIQAAQSEMGGTVEAL